MVGSGRCSAHGLQSTEQQGTPLAWVNVGNLGERGVARVGSHLLVHKEILLKLDPQVIFVDGGGLALIALDYRKKPGDCRSLQELKTAGCSPCGLSISSPPTSARP